MQRKTTIGKKVFTMLIITVLLAIATTSVVSIVQLKRTSKSDLDTLKENVHSDYDNMIAYEVETAVSMINPIGEKVKSGELSEKEGKELAAAIIRNARYGEQGYFWVDDYEGNNDVLLGLDIEGTNRLNFKDANGFEVMKETIKIAKGEGKGYIDFWYPKKGEQEESPKRGFVMGYDEFEWVIGTGNYIDDLETIVNTQKEKNNKKLYGSYIYLGAICVLIVILCIVLSVLFSKKLQSQLTNINKAMDKIANCNLDTEDEIKALSKYYNNKDDIGDMIRSISLMIENLRKMLGDISSYASNTAETAKELTITSQTTYESANEVASAVGNIADGATSQAEDTTKAAVSIDENTKSLNEMIVVLEELKSAITDIDNKKDEGKFALEELDRLTDVNVEESEFVNSIILETNESAESISKASEMIQSIADQTNLLALNAAIELAVGM